MMNLLKRVIIAVLIVVLLPVNVMGQPLNEESTLFFSDGSQIKITTCCINAKTANQKVGSRAYEYIDAAGETQWIATLSGYFTYDGTTSTCTYSSLNVEIVNTNWYIVSGLSQESGNSATAELIMGYKTLGITSTKKTVHMSISCDPNGNLS